MSDVLDDVKGIIAALPLEELVQLGEYIATMVQARTPESVLRAGEQAVDIVVDQFEDAKFGKG